MAERAGFVKAWKHPAASRWLGHKDAGALAMKTYGPLRNDTLRRWRKKWHFAAGQAKI